MKKRRFLYGLIGGLGGIALGVIECVVHVDLDWHVVLLDVVFHGLLGLMFGLVLQVMKDQNTRMHRSCTTSLNALANAVAAKDDETNGHCKRVVQYSILIGQEIGLDKHLMQQLEWGALLHDIGKIAVPDAILKKPAALTEEEWVIMKEHPYMGYLMVKEIDFLEEGCDVVLHHHERWDGQGYPKRLGGEDIPLLARIFSVADTFDAITSDRPYRQAQSIEHARAEILKNSDTQFCHGCVEAFLRIPEDQLIRVQEEAKILEYDALQLQKLKHIS